MSEQGQTTRTSVRQPGRAWWEIWWETLRRGLASTQPGAEPRAEAEAEAQPEAQPEAEASTTAPGSPLYQHSAQRHQPRNVNRMHRQEQEAAGFNTRLAVWLTKNVGTMQCAYLFAGIGIGSLVGVATNNVVLAAVFGSVSSYFLQLVLLPILSVGQNVLGRHQELQAEEVFKTSQRSFRDIEEIMAHLAAQDEELLKHTRLLLQLAGEAGEAGEAGAAGGGAGVPGTSGTTGAEPATALESLPVAPTRKARGRGRANA